MALHYARLSSPLPPDRICDAPSYTLEKIKAYISVSGKPLSNIHGKGAP